MYPDEKVELGNVTIMFDGEVVGTVESVSYDVVSNEAYEVGGNLNFSHPFEATLEVDYINEEFFEQLGLYEWQKALLRQELRKQKLESAKENKLGMRESINNHFKRGKKW